MTALRVYDPAECDEHGIPLDWEKCRTCKGHGTAVYCVDPHGHRNGCGCPLTMCQTCDGHGSLKAAALAEWRNTYAPDLTGVPIEDHHPACALRQGDGPSCICPVRLRVPKLLQDVRCEDCGHPMNEGTWDNPSVWPDDSERIDMGLEMALHNLRNGQIPTVGYGVHYSPCDEGCRHDQEGLRQAVYNVSILYPDLPHRNQRVTESSWRPVDVRTLGWPHDLRPEKLAVLCLRCYAERTGPGRTRD